MQCSNFVSLIYNPNNVISVTALSTYLFIETSIILIILYATSLMKLECPDDNMSLDFKDQKNPKLTFSVALVEVIFSM